VPRRGGVFRLVPRRMQNARGGVFLFRLRGVCVFTAAILLCLAATHIQVSGKVVSLRVPTPVLY
jgi:hypothetical protein